MTTLTLFSRPGCHLCEEMIDELRPLVAGIAEIEVVDISHDGDLTQRYGLAIPVLMHADEELARYRLDHDRIAEFIARLSP